MKSSMADTLLQKILPVVSAAFAVALTVELAWDYRFATDVDLQTAGLDNAGLPLTDKPAPLPPIEHYHEIIERPLFMPGRRPRKPEMIVEFSPELSRQERLTLDGYSLSGVVISGNTRLALIQSSPDRKSQILTEKESLGDWRLVGIEPARVTLGNGTQVRTLALTVQGPITPAPGTGPAAAHAGNSKFNRR